MPSMRGAPRLGAFGLMLALLISGCSSSEPASDGETTAGNVSCTADARVESFHQGMAKDGRRGVLTFELLESEPAPPAKGDNRFELAVIDESGAPAMVSLGVELSMPDHGHGSRVAPNVSFEAARGSFGIAPLDLFMAGVWRIDFAASADDATPIDDASFFFCIEG
jgi:hypothetical protein